MSTPQVANVQRPVLMSSPQNVNIPRPVSAVQNVNSSWPSVLISGQPPPFHSLPPPVSTLSGPLLGSFPGQMPLTRPPTGPSQIFSVPFFQSRGQPPPTSTITNGPRPCLLPSPNIALPNTSVPPPNFRPQVQPPYYPPGPQYLRPLIQAPPSGPRGPPPILGPYPMEPAQSNQRPPPQSQREPSESRYRQDRGESSSYSEHCQRERPKEGSVLTESSESSLQSSQDRRGRSRSNERYRKSDRKRSRSRERERGVRSESRGSRDTHRSYRYPSDRRDRDSRDSRRSPSRERRRDNRRSRSRDRKHRSRSRESRRPRSRDRNRRSRSRSRQRKKSRSRDRSRRSRSRGERSHDSRRSRSSERQRERSYRSESHLSLSSQKSSERRSPGRKRDGDKASGETRREELVEKWRRLNCKDDEELEKRLLEISKMNSDQLLEEQSGYWIRSAPATIYYQRDNE